MKVRIGDRVRLAEIDGKANEEGVVLTIDECWWGTSLVVLVDSQFQEGPQDDLLRTCREDQIMEVINNQQKK